MKDAMQPLFAAAGLIFVAASTPGPNNFIVMRAAAAQGLMRTLPLIGGIVVGSLLMLLFASTGMGIVVAESPALGAAFALVSAAYLVFLGLSIALQGSPDRGHDHTPACTQIQTPLGLLLFQLANPKTWLMIVTAVGSGAALAHLVIAMGAITTLCLLVWSWFGSLLQVHLQRPQFARWFNFAAGGCLAGSAFMVLV